MHDDCGFRAPDATNLKRLGVFFDPVELVDSFYCRYQVFSGGRGHLDKCVGGVLQHEIH